MTNVRSHGNLAFLTLTESMTPRLNRQPICLGCKSIKACSGSLRACHPILAHLHSYRQAKSSAMAFRSVIQCPAEGQPGLLQFYLTQAMIAST